MSTEKIDKNTITQIDNWNFEKGKELPEDYNYGGSQNAGKVLKCGADGFIRLANGGGTTYTGTNGIEVDNTNYTIGVDTTTGIDDAKLTGTTNAENMTFSGDLTMSKGAHFTATSTSQMTVDCEADFNDTVDMSGADKVLLPTVTLTGTSGTLTIGEYTILAQSDICVLDLDDQHFYFESLTQDSSSHDILTYANANGKITILYDRTWSYTSTKLYQHNMIWLSNGDEDFLANLSIITNSSEELLPNTVWTYLKTYFDSLGNYPSVMLTGEIKTSSNRYPITSAWYSKSMHTIVICYINSNFVRVNVSYDITTLSEATDMVDTVVELR